MLIDKYGADAVRFGIMISSPAGNDLLFDENGLEQGRNFNNKIWNALKLVTMWSQKITDEGLPADQQQSSLFAINWFENRLRQAGAEIDALMQQFRLSEALKTLYSLIWDDFCSWYLEWVKPGFESPVIADVYHKTVAFFTDLMQLLHPFMPFVTEEIYHLLEDRDDDLCIKQFSPAGEVDKKVLEQGKLLQDLISGIRDMRNKNQLKPKESIVLHLDSPQAELIKPVTGILSRQVNASAINLVTETISGTIQSVIGKTRVYVETEKPLDNSRQKQDMLKELEHLKGFLTSVQKKLVNDKFVQNARPEVIALEQKKRSDAETKIRVLEESLSVL